MDLQCSASKHIILRWTLLWAFSPRGLLVLVTPCLPPSNFKMHMYIINGEPKEQTSKDTVVITTELEFMVKSKTCTAAFLLVHFCLHLVILMQ